jgi:capsular polysaccharide biosynthesis protein
MMVANLAWRRLADRLGRATAGRDPCALLIQDAVITPSLVDETAETLLGAVYREGRVVVPSQRVTAFPLYRHVDPPIIARPAAAMQLDEAHYLGHFFAHFGHFLIETFLSFSDASLADRHPLIFQPWPHATTESAFALPHVRFFLAALGIEASRILLVRSPMIVRRLHLVPRVPVVDGVVPPWTRDRYGRVRQRALRLPAPAGHQRLIYMSRRRFGGQQRAIANEDAVEETFARRGFSIVYPETLPIETQVALVARAGVLAGIDGSALHLSALMAPGSRVLVVNSRYRNPAIHAIGEAMGLQTTDLDVCSSEPRDGKQLITVDVAALSRALTEPL